MQSHPLAMVARALDACGRAVPGRTVHWVSADSTIVAVSSTSGVNAPAGQANYAASKAGLAAMIRVLAKELGSHGVRVNAVVPGFVDTAMTHAMPRKQFRDDRAPEVMFRAATRIL